MDTDVVPGEATVVVNGEAGLQLPSVNVNAPPLLPVSVASGPFKIDIMVPGGASISKMAG
jgi:hypothetical protein